MSDVQFSEPTYARSAASVRRPAGLAGLVMRAGLAKDQRGAQAVLVILLVIVVILTLGIWFWGSDPATPALPPPDDLVPGGRLYEPAR